MLLEDSRRINVLLSRAKFKIVFVGSLSTLSNQDNKKSDICCKWMGLMESRDWVTNIPPNSNLPLSSLPKVHAN